MTQEYVRTLTIEEAKAMSEEDLAELFSPYTDEDGLRKMFGYPADVVDIDMSLCEHLAPPHRRIYNCNVWVFSIGLQTRVSSTALPFIVFVETSGMLFGQYTNIGIFSESGWSASLYNILNGLCLNINKGEGNVSWASVAPTIYNGYPDIWYAAIRDIAMRRMWPKLPEVSDPFTTRLDLLVQQSEQDSQPQ